MTPRHYADSLMLRFKISTTMTYIRHQLTAFVALAALCCAQPSAAQRVDYQRSDSIKVVKLLRDASRLSPKTNYMLYFGRKLRGLPYVGKTLEKNSNEQLVVNLRQMDCTTFTETVLALSRCMKQHRLTFADYCSNLRLFRYKDGVVSYPNRLHYFTYWMSENVGKGLVSIVSEPRTVFTATQTVRANYMTTHRSLYPMLVKHQEWVPQIAEMERSITGTRHPYIPKSGIVNTARLRQTIHDGDVIVILTSKRGLDTSHIGIAVWHKDGLHLLNASSIHRKVVEEPMTFRQYMMKHPTHTGIRVARLN